VHSEKLHARVSDDGYGGSMLVLSSTLIEP